MALRIIELDGRDLFEARDGKAIPIKASSFYEFEGKQVRNWKLFKRIFYDCLDLIRFEQVLLDNNAKKRCIFPYRSRDDTDATDQIICLKFNRVVKEKLEQDGKEKKKKLLSVDEIRHQLYADGFILDGEHYSRWKRSSSNARKGVCYFINDKWLDAMNRYDNLGIQSTEKRVIADYEATRSLTMSHIIGCLDIRPENILLIDDIESKFQNDIMLTSVKNSSLVTERGKNYKITNKIFDGQSLMDESLFPDEYKDKGMLLLRNIGFKSCCFNAKVQQWFADNGITDIEQLKGIHAPGAKLEDIKLITTGSSIKYMKYGTFYEWLDKITQYKSNAFGIVKYEKPTKYFDGQLVRTNYQIMNSLQLSREDVNELMKPTLDYMQALIDDPILMYRHCKDISQNDEGTAAEFIQKMLSMNKDLSQTDMYQVKAKAIVENIRSEAKQGRILIRGNFSTMVSCPIEMLQTTIGTYKGESVLGIGNILTIAFDEGKLFVARNPHICAGNVYLPNNVKNALIEKYLNLSPNIVVVNTINENIMQRLGGADFDSDQVLISNNEILIRTADMNYDIYPVPTQEIESDKKEESYTPENIAKTDHHISETNKLIGQIVNVSQKLNSKLWDGLAKTMTPVESAQMYRDISQLSVMQTLAIDSAKRNPKGIELSKEFEKMLCKYGLLKYPIFFKEVDRHKTGIRKPNRKSEHYLRYHTTCDLMEELISYRRFIFDTDGRPIKTLYNKNIRVRGKPNIELIDELHNFYDEKVHEELEIREECSGEELRDKLRELREEFSSREIANRIPKIKFINIPTIKYLIENYYEEENEFVEYILIALVDLESNSMKKLFENPLKIDELVVTQETIFDYKVFGLKLRRVA